jgi:putative membrane protein
VRILTWLVRAAAFLLLLAFAVKNTEPITLRFYFDLAWQAPLVLLLLAFFTVGALVGLAATLTTILRQRRELQQLRREQRGPAAAAAQPRLPPVTDG